MNDWDVTMSSTDTFDSSKSLIWICMEMSDLFCWCTSVILSWDFPNILRIMVGTNLNSQTGNTTCP